MVSLLIYVDDILIYGSDDMLIGELKQLLHTKSRIKDLGKVRYFLAIAVA